MKSTKRFLAMATLFAMVLGAVGISGFAAAWKAEAQDEIPSIGGEYGDTLFDLTVSNGEPATVNLVDVSGKYYVDVTVYDGTLANGSKLYASVDGGTATELPYIYGMSGNAAILDLTGAKTLTISTDNAEMLMFGLSIYTYIDADEVAELPKAMTSFTLYTAYLYKFVIGTDGFYSVNNVSVSADGVTEGLETSYFLAIKEDPNYLVANYVYENNYPVYLKAGTYYLSITYTFAYYETTIEGELTPVYPEVLSAQFEVVDYDYESEEIVVDDVTYVPVTQEGGVTYPIKLAEDLTGSYSLVAFELPEGVGSVDVYSESGEHLATLSTAAGLITAIDVTDATSLYFTSAEPFVMGIMLQSTEVGELTIDKTESIMLYGGETKTYVLPNLGLGEFNGSYSITVKGNNGDVEVWSSVGVLVQTGYNFGVFSISAREDGNYPNYFLLFMNRGYEDVTVEVTVKEFNEEVYSFGLGTSGEITLGVGEIQGYYVKGILETGGYNVELSANTGVVVTNSFVNSVVESGKTHGSFTATEAVLFDEETMAGERVGRFLLVFENTSSTEAKFTATVTRGEMLELNKAHSITINGSVAYNMLLPTGVYEISLNSEKVAVTVNSEELHLYNGNVGSFFVASIDPTDPEEGDTPTDATVAIQFSTTEEVAFTVTVKNATKLELDTPTTITLDGSEVYYMTLPAGEYSILLDDTVATVYVNGLEVIPLGEGYGTFTVTTVEPEEGAPEDAYVTILFSGIGTSTVTVNKL